MNAFAANLIWLLHMLLIVWVVVVPFTNNEPFLVLHLIMLPFMWVHWILDEDTCCLTLVEQKLRGLDPSECAEKSFFYNLVSPVYKIQDADIRKVAWVASVVLWLITLSKVMRRPSMIKDMFTNAKRAARGEPLIKPAGDEEAAGADIEKGVSPGLASPPPTRG